jgi:hypothetical protein
MNQIQKNIQNKDFEAAPLLPGNSKAIFRAIKTGFSKL